MATPASAMPEFDDRALREEISTAERKLGRLETELESVEAELDGLSEQRETWEILEQALGSLEQLEANGASHLFWGEDSTGRTERQVKAARERSDDYLGRIGEIEQHRDEVAEEIRRGEEILAILEADLQDIEIEQEDRRNEWHVEREISDVPDRVAILPWEGVLDERRRLRKSLSSSLVVALVLGAIIPFIDLPLPDLELIPEVPERFANLIEQQVPPPPAPVVEQAPPEEVVADEPLEVDELPQEVPDIPVQPTPVEAEPAPEQQVRSAGILAFRESIGNIDREVPAALGAQASINNAGESAVGRTERAMVSSQAPGSSGGINLASLSRDVGGGSGEGLDGVQVTRVASSIGVSGNGDRPMAAGAAAGRTDEEIQIVFDRYKSSLYRLYNRELRNDPTLRGQVVLRLTIEPDGSVSFCEVQNSDMGAPALEQQIVDRVLTFDFGAKEGITALTILYPIDFLPAG